VLKKDFVLLNCGDERAMTNAGIPNFNQDHLPDLTGQDAARVVNEPGARKSRRMTSLSKLSLRKSLSDFPKPCKINRLQTKKDSIPIAVRPGPAISPHPPQPPAATFNDRAYIFPSPDNPERPIASVRKAHDGAVRRAKAKPAFRLYDLRHTYASRYASRAVMAGVDLPTLGALLGHTTVQMTMRYVHPAEEHKREAAAKIENFKAMSVIKLAERNQGVPTVSTTVQ
jgi:integrase